MNKLIYIQNLKDIIKIKYNNELNEICSKFLKNAHNLYEDEITKNFNEFKIEICKALDKSIDIKRNDISYNNEWALKSNNYTEHTPTEEILENRKNMINKIYLIYDKYIILDDSILSPDDWAYPPQYCYEDQLKSNLDGFESEYNYIKIKTIQKIKDIINKEYKNISIEDDLYMDHFY